MSENNKSSTDELISCEICMKELPKSDAKSAEVSDYAMYFCGLECFQQWQQDQPKEKK